MVCMANRLQCETLHFAKHIFPYNTECSNGPEINCTELLYDPLVTHFMSVHAFFCNSIWSGRGLTFFFGGGGGGLAR